jgi:hypothetical protein
MSDRATGYATLAAVCLAAAVVPLLHIVPAREYPLWFSLGLPTLFTVAAIRGPERVLLGCAALGTFAVLNAGRSGFSWAPSVALVCCAAILSIAAGREPGSSNWRQVVFRAILVLMIVAAIILLPYFLF